MVAEADSQTTKLLHLGFGDAGVEAATMVQAAVRGEGEQRAPRRSERASVTRKCMPCRAWYGLLSMVAEGATHRSVSM